jgi:hypothetical protein
MQDKTSTLSTISAQIGLEMRPKKTKVQKIDASSTRPSISNGSNLDEVGTFPFLTVSLTSKEVQTHMSTQE